MAIMNLDNYIKYKESEHYIAYLSKVEDQGGKDTTRQMIVYYKDKNIYMQCILNQSLLDLFFNSTSVKETYLQSGHQR